MAKVLSFVTTDTPISGVTTNPIEIAKVNFGADFVEKVSPNKGEVLITNVTAPIGRAETYRYALQSVADVYKGSDIEPSLRVAGKKGFSLVIQHNYVMVETDPNDPTYERLLPFSGHTVLKFPAVESLTADKALMGFQRLLAPFFDTGSHIATRIAQLYRGVLKPSDVD